MDDTTGFRFGESGHEQPHTGNSTLTGSWKLSKFSLIEEKWKGIPRKEKAMLKRTEFQKCLRNGRHAGLVWIE